MSTRVFARTQTRILLLGPVEVYREGRAARLGGVKQRILLARLALAEGRSVLSEALIDDLWGRNPPDGARHALQSHISRLRQTTGIPIDASTGGYSLNPDVVEVDTTRFAQLCESGQSLIESGQPSQASDVLNEALGLWRGPAFADVGELASLRPYAIRLEEMWRSASADRIDACLGCGEEESVIGDLRAVLDDDPLRERTWRQLMIALYRQGRESEALAAFRAARNLFIEELGSEPGQQLADVHMAILERSLPPPDVQPSSHTVQPGQPRQPIQSTQPRQPTHPSDPQRLTGRADELRALNAAWTAAHESIRLVSIGGEPGMGKTRLANEFAAALRSAGVRVYEGRCDREQSAPYRAFTEIMRAYRAGNPEQDLHDAFGKHTVELSRVLPELESVTSDSARPSDLAGLSSHHTFDAVADWLETISDCQPIALVIDDIHWADHQTLLLVQHLMDSPRRIRALLIVTLRDRRHPDSHDSLATFMRQSERVTHLPLRRLSTGEIDELLSQDPALGDVSPGLSEPAVDLIRSASGGNPLFVVELARQYASTHDVSPDRNLTIPSGLRDVIDERLEPLSGSALEILQCAALIGAQFDAMLLREVMNTDASPIDDAISAAVGDGLIDASGGTRFQFSHDVVRAALHESVPSLRAAELHRRIAEAIERLYADSLESHYPQLAQHFGAATDPVSRRRAAEYFMRAGNDAMVRNAPTVAAGFYHDAIGAAAGDETMCIDAQISLGTAQFHAADSTYRATLLEAARRATAIDDSDRLAAAAVANTRGWWSSTSDIDHERVAIIETALRSDHPVDVRVRLLSSWAQENVRDPQRRDESIRRSDTALDLAERHCSEPIIARILPERYAVLYASFTDVAECVRINERLLEIAHCQGDPGLRLSASVGLAQSTMTLGEFAVADRYLDQASQLAATHHQPTRLWMIRCWQAVRVAMRGRLEEAEDLINDAMELGVETEQPDALTWFVGQIFTIRMMDDRLPEIIDQVTEQVNTYAQGIPSWQAAKALALASAGENDEAGRILERFVAASFEQLPQDMLWLHGMAYLCATCSILKRDDLAPDLYKTLAAYSGLMAHNGTIDAGPVDLHLAAMARLAGLADEAEHHEYAAAALCRRIDAPIWLAKL